jgi:hypothetical protein
MIVSFRDELGYITIRNIDDIQFDGERAYFTDENGTDFKVNVQHLVSILTNESADRLCGYAE